MNKSIILFLLTALLFGACEERFSQVVDIDIPEHESKIVSYCILDASQDTINVEVSRSQDILSEDAPYINDALIRFYKGEDFITDDFTLVKRFVDLDYSTPQMDSIFVYKYQSNPGISIVQGEKLSIEVAAAGLESINASAIVPNLVALQEIELIDDGIIDPEGYTSDELKINFKDPVDEDNYYILTAQIVEYLDDYKYSNPVYLSAIDPRINESSYGTPFIEDLYNYVYFNDKDGINGTESSFSFAASIYSSSEDEKILLHVKLYSLSRELYDFCHALNQYAKGDDILFAEPVTIPSNFENGFGVFGIYDYTEKTIEL